MAEVTSEAPAPPASMRVPGVVLAAGTMAANLAGYLFFLILSRALDADSLGAVGSLVNLTLIATVPALALQLVAARVVARRGSVEAAERAVLLVALAIGAVIALVILAASPLLTHLLRLASPTPILFLAASVPGISVTFGVQGILQGEERFVRLAALLSVTAVARVASAVIAASAGLGPEAIMLVLALGWYAAALVGLGLRRHARGESLADVRLAQARSSVAPVSPRRIIRSTLATAASTSSLLLLSSIDVLLARYFLDGTDSGAYTVGALFGKAALWGPSFLATLYYPRLTRPEGRARALAAALGLTAGVGALGILLAAVAGTPLVRLVAGEGYDDVGPLIWAFTAFGVTLAVVQVLVYASLALSDHRLGGVVWTASAVAVLVVALWQHDSIAEIVLTLAATGASVAVIGVALELARRSSVSRVEP